MQARVIRRVSGRGATELAERSQNQLPPEDASVYWDIEEDSFNDWLIFPRHRLGEFWVRARQSSNGSIGTFSRNEQINWRRKRDSNPRTSYPVNGFQDRRFQPLTHSSVFILLDFIASLIMCLAGLAMLLASVENITVRQGVVGGEW
jgi:hypothetical protein